MARENQELRTAVQHNSLTVTCDPETEPVLDVRSLPQRPVSMYETRESLRAQVKFFTVVARFIFSSIEYCNGELLLLRFFTF